MDSKALKQWEKSEISYKNYMIYIHKKSDKFKLSMIDLFYVSNFKGGYATINEPENVIEAKLLKYSEIFVKINSKFLNQKLNILNENEVSDLIFFSEELFKLTIKGNINKIDGFSVSFITTLLHFYFPNLYPILDKRVLNGLKLINKEKDLDTQNQVKKIYKFYPKLIEEFKNLTVNKTIRELDKELFIIKF